MRIYKNGQRHGRDSRLRPLYPNLVEWMDVTGTTYEAVYRLSGIANGTFYNIIYGLVDPRKSTVDRVLEMTGMTYEEAFHEA